MQNNIAGFVSIRSILSRHQLNRAKFSLWQVQNSLPNIHPIFVSANLRIQFSEPQLKAVKTRLECRSGRFLEVKIGGDPTKATVHGAESGTGTGTLFFLIPVGLRVVAIQHVDTKLYISMNDEGKLIPSVKLSSWNSNSSQFLGVFHERMQIQRKCFWELLVHIFFLTIQTSRNTGNWGYFIIIMD